MGDLTQVQTSEQGVISVVIAVKESSLGRLPYCTVLAAVEPVEAWRATVI